MSTLPPFLTAVLVAGPQRQRSGRALQSLLDQGAGDELEIMLIDRDSAAGMLPGSASPQVRILPLRPEESYLAARIAAIGQARGEVVAFVEEHATAMPGWFAALKHAFRSETWAGIGCEMHNANPGQGISNAVALMNYQTWTAPAIPGACDMLPGHNSAYRRNVLLEQAADLPALLQSEVLLQWRLSETGHRLAIVPTARMTHLNEGGLTSICRGYFLWNRCFADSRARLYRWSLLKKLARVAATPLFPFVRLARTAACFLTRSPRRLGLLLLYWPVFLIAWYAAGTGQAVGLMRGAGDAETRFSDYELATPRPEPAARR